MPSALPDSMQGIDVGTFQLSLHFAPWSLIGLHQYICTKSSESHTLALFCMQASVSYTGILLHAGVNLLHWRSFACRRQSLTLALLHAGDPKLSAENKAVLRAGAKQASKKLLQTARAYLFCDPRSGFTLMFALACGGEPVCGLTRVSSVLPCKYQQPMQVCKTTVCVTMVVSEMIPAVLQRATSWSS